MLVLPSWIYSLVARVFMISLVMVLERLKNCTMFVIKLWHTMGNWLLNQCRFLPRRKKIGYLKKGT